jgi:hypothetical protein
LADGSVSRQTEPPPVETFIKKLQADQARGPRTKVKVAVTAPAQSKKQKKRQREKRVAREKAAERKATGSSAAPLKEHSQRLAAGEVAAEVKAATSSSPASKAGHQKHKKELRDAKRTKERHNAKKC